jgi:hypothetical protein
LRRRESTKPNPQQDITPAFFPQAKRLGMPWTLPHPKRFKKSRRTFLFHIYVLLASAEEGQNGAQLLNYATTHIANSIVFQSNRSVSSSRQDKRTNLHRISIYFIKFLWPLPPNPNQPLLGLSTDISQYRLRFGFSLLYKIVFHLNSLTAQLSYEGRAAMEGAK